MLPSIERLTGAFPPERLADVALLALAAELALVAIVWRRKLVKAAAAAAPGALLLMSLRSALAGDVLACALWLAASLPAHLYDLSRRMQGGR